MIKKLALPKSLIVKAIVISFCFVLVLSPTNNIWAGDGSLEKQVAMHQTGQQLLQVASELHRRGSYKASEQALQRTQKYFEYLSNAEQEKFSDLVEKNNIALVERQAILEHIAKSFEFSEAKDFAAAKAELVKIQNNSFLTAAEQKRVAEDINQLDKKIGVQVRSAKQVVKDKVSLDVAEEMLDTAEPVIEVRPAEKPKASASVRPVKVGAEKVDGSYIDVVTQKRNRQRSYTRAVVNDSVTKARQYIAEQKFNEATGKVESATNIVNKNKLLLGNELYAEYSGTLNQLKEQIAQAEFAILQQKAIQKRKEAEKLQKKLRQQQDSERSQRVDDLMNNAIAFQKQQRYKDSLGQVEILLGIDPLNEQAMLMQQTLEDVISFRDQLEVQREADREERDMMLETDRSKIPYAEEFRYPKDWRELTKDREIERAAGLSRVDAAVYRQLSQLVDLSSFTLDMPFDEALEILTNSIEPPLRITTMWRDLSENAYIEQGTPINMQGLSGIPLKKGLELLLNSVSGELAELDYVVSDGIITIATKGSESLPSRHRTDVYNVEELLGLPANFASALNTASGATAGGGGSSRGGGASGGGASGGVEQLLGTEQILQRSEEIVNLIEDTVEPDSWYAAGGEGTIRVYGTKLIVNQTPEVHEKITKLIDDLRRSLGEQVAIEARFLTVGENFLEDIGVDVDFDVINAGGKWGIISALQGSSESIIPNRSNIDGSFDLSALGNISDAITISGGYGSILDDLQVSFLIRATQAHRNSKTLTAPKVTVLSGESASIRIEKQTAYIAEWELESEAVADQVPRLISAEAEIESIFDGIVLNVTPTISSDKKYVLLRITTSLTQLFGFDERDVGLIGDEGEGRNFLAQLPLTETAEVRTRVSVPDGGTLLIGGQKLTDETDLEEGVPVLSKLPIFGRLFKNRSKIKDSSVLLILVKPTIILREEAEKKAFGTIS